MPVSSLIRDHLRSNLVGYLALFVALTIAPAWAATLKNGSVTTKKLRNGAVTAKKVQTGAITAPKLAANSVDGSKVASNSLTGADINEGTLTGVPGGPPSGSAGGELAGTYPNPEIGVVDGLEIADASCGTSGGIHLGTGDAQICTPVGAAPFNNQVAVDSPNFTTNGDTNLGNVVGEDTEVAGTLELLNANTASGELRFCNGTGGGCGGSGAYASLLRSADNVLHTDDSFDADGSLTVDGNTTLGSADTDVVNVDAAPLNLRQADSASDALVFGSGITTNLYRSGISPATLRTDNDLEVGGALDSDSLAMPTDTTAGPTVATDTAVIFVGCSAGFPTVFVKWPDGEFDPIANDAGPSAGETCP